MKKVIFTVAIPIIIGGTALLFYSISTHKSNEVNSNNSLIKEIEFPCYAGEVNEELVIEDEIDDNNIKNSNAVNEFFTVTEENENNIEKIKTFFSLNNNQVLNPGETKDIKTDVRLTIYDNGTFCYKNNANSDAEVKITDDKCKEIALQFIVDSGISVDDYKYSGIGYDISTDLQTNKDKKIAKSVYFTKNINNIDVEGNTKFYISIIEDGAISTVYSSNTEIENKHEVDESDIVSLDEAIEKAKNLEGYIEFPEETDKIVLDKAEIVYWEDSAPGSDNNTIQPVYRLQGTAYCNNSIVGEVQFIESALK